MGVFLVIVAFILFNFPNVTRNKDYLIYDSDIQNQNGSATSTVGIAGVLGPDSLYIQKIGISVPIIYVADDRESTFQKGLEKGVVHYPGTAKPGELGNAYIFGHSSDFFLARGNYKTVFANLPKLEAGDKIYVTDQENELYTYTVLEGRIVENDDLSVLSQFNYEEKLLTLQTSYPIGTADKRYVVIAELK